MSPTKFRIQESFAYIYALRKHTCVRVRTFYIAGILVYLASKTRLTSEPTTGFSGWSFFAMVPRPCERKLHTAPFIVPLNQPQLIFVDTFSLMGIGEINRKGREKKLISWLEFRIEVNLVIL